MGAIIPWLIRFGPLAVIGLAAAAAVAAGVPDHLTLAVLAARHEAIRGYAGDHPIVSFALFIAGFSLFICLSLPGLSLGAALAGLMFGAVVGSFAAVAGA